MHMHVSCCVSARLLACVSPRRHCCRAVAGGDQAVQRDERGGDCCGLLVRCGAHGDHPETDAGGGAIVSV